MKKKTILIIILSILIIIVIGITSLKIFYKESKNSKPSEIEQKVPTITQNTNPLITENKTIDNLEFTEFNCYYNETSSILTYKVKNISPNPIDLNQYIITFKDKNNNIVTTFEVYSDHELQQNEEYTTGNTSAIDLSKAYSLEISKKSS